MYESLNLLKNFSPQHNVRILDSVSQFLDVILPIDPCLYLFLRNNSEFIKLSDDNT